MSASVALSISTILALAGAILVGLAFGTNSWLRITVDRERIQELADDNDTDGREAYFSRSYGLFRKCFVGDAKPLGTPTYKSPLGDECRDMRYDQKVDHNFSDIVKEFYHLRRTYLALYVVGLALIVIAMLFLLFACGKRSSRLTVITGILLFLSASFIAGSIGVWHRVQDIFFNDLLDFGYEPLRNDEYMKSWPQIVQDTTDIAYCWSYICAWVGVGCLLLGSIAMCASSNVLKNSKKQEYVKAHQVMYTSPSGTYDKAMGLSPYAYLNYAYNPYATYGYNPYSYYGPYAWMYYGYGGNNGNNTNNGIYGTNSALYGSGGVQT